ncbi:YfhO family protein [Ferrimicrobium sp.]|uniref:YfhO family protein n=1 Tax=Ferrimicrobium sp. TaxID=2926050 RepID=UPI00261A7219|nr:YfhO family protein [Ferrimicrobium sp.]
MALTAIPASDPQYRRMQLRLRTLWSLYAGDLAGVVFLVAVICLYLSPAIKDGAGFGPADLGRHLSLLTRLAHATRAPRGIINGDIVTQGAAWNTLDWELVHHGQFPLWNDLSGTGLPQFLNFESAPLALPTLIGYLVPLRFAYLVTVAMKLLIAGTGTYLTSRLLGLRPLSATFAGTTAMLSGAFAGWLGWAISGPLAWAGWLLAAGILLYRAKPGDRAKWYGLLALSVAFSIYGGFPEVYVLMAGAFGLLFGFAGIARRLNGNRIDWAGVRRLGIGLGIGLALAMPLWLPGIQTLRGSVRNSEGASVGLSFHALTLLVAQGYDGLPFATKAFPNGTFFGSSNYYETAAYVGVIALVLASTAIIVWWRRPIVVGLTASAVGALLVAYQIGSGAPIQHLIADLGLGSVAPQRILAMLGFAIALLAGLGLEVLLRHWCEPRTKIAFAISVGIMVVVLTVLWDRSSIGAVALPGGHLTASQATALRQRSLYWPTAEVLGLLVMALLLQLHQHTHQRLGTRNARRVRSAMGVLVAAQAGFLVVAGVGINSYEPTTYPVTPAVKALKRLVGTSLVGLDSVKQPCTPGETATSCALFQWDGIGLYPEMNLAYGIAEFAMYDPVIPHAFLNAYPAPHVNSYQTGANLFSPIVNSASLARAYGIGYLIVQSPLPIPKGTQLVGTVTASGLALNVVRVLGSHRFSFAKPTATTKGQAVTTQSRAHQRSDIVNTTSHPNDARYVVDVRAPRRQKLMIRITDVPGWHATANGHPIAIHRATGDLMSATVPAGTRVIEITYGPALLGVGELFAFTGLLGLALYRLLETLRRRSTVKQGR